MKPNLPGVVPIGTNLPPTPPPPGTGSLPAPAPVPALWDDFQRQAQIIFYYAFTDPAQAEKLVEFIKAERAKK